MHVHARHTCMHAHMCTLRNTCTHKCTHAHSVRKDPGEGQAVCQEGHSSGKCLPHESRNHAAGGRASCSALGPGWREQWPHGTLMCRRGQSPQLGRWVPAGTVRLNSHLLVAVPGHAGETVTLALLGLSVPQLHAPHPTQVPQWLPHHLSPVSLTSTASGFLLEQSGD